MGKRIRTFVAARCAPDVCARLRREADRLAGLDGGFRAPATDDFHLTLQFLGDTDEGDVVAIGGALREAAAAAAPLALRYGGLGAFPTPARARVVWAAARETERPGALAALVRALGERLGPLGYPPERRAHHAHVTLGRLRRRPGTALAEAVEAARDLDLGAQVLSDVRLILSEPAGGRYRYIDLTKASLGPDPGAGGEFPGGGA